MLKETMLQEKMLQEKILAYIENKDMESLKNQLADADDKEILYAFHDISSEEQVIAFRLLAKDSALSIFEQLDTDQQQNLLHSFTGEKVAEFIDGLAPDDRVRLLDELPATVAKQLIGALSPQERAVTNILMGYEPETAGRIMTTEHISLKKSMTAAQALAKVRKEAKDKETIYTLYVTDGAKKLEGVLSLKELLTAGSNSVIEDVMSKQVIKVSTGANQKEAARVLQELDLLAIPVVDKEERLIGIITIDDALDVLEEEVTNDMYDQAGLADITGSESGRSDVLINGKLWDVWRVRLPFLLITLVAGVVLGAVIDTFESRLESIAVVAIFIPLIMHMGGNVGTQSATVFVRGMVLGHIQIKFFLRHFLKEVCVGLSIGVLIGTVAGVIAYIWQGMYMLGLAVGLALTASLTMAALFGFLVPYVLIKLNTDQAAGSAPIITSIQDILGIVIYFMLVSTFLGGMV